MVVVPECQMRLMRKRRELKKLIAEHQWEEVLRMERMLFSDISLAVQDPHRPPKELLIELSGVINLYKELSIACKEYSQELGNVT